MNLDPRLKTAIRKVTRRWGYDLVPFDSDFIALQKSILRTIDLVVDVGANTGQYAERLRQLGYAKPIISFEPGVDPYSYLAASARRDGSWTARQVALGAGQGSAVLHVTANGMSSSLRQPLEAHVGADKGVRVVDSYKVAVATLDSELADDEGDSLWLKLDVQGHELEVLRGGPATLSRSLAVQVEMSFVQLYTDQAPWLDLVAHLLEKGLVLCHLDPGFVDRRTGFLQQADGLFLSPAGLEMAR